MQLLWFGFLSLVFFYLRAKKIDEGKNISGERERKDLGGKKERNIREVIFWRGGLLLLLQKRERGEDKRLC